MTTSISSTSVFGIKQDQDGIKDQEEEDHIYGIPYFYADIFVDDDNTEGPWDGTYEYPYQHIQDGVYAANDDDVVYVFNGIYDGDVVISNSLILTGQNRDNTIIRGGQYPVRIITDGVTVRGFGITRHPDSDSSYFTGISVSSSNDVTIQSNKIINAMVGEGFARGIEIYNHCNNIVVKENLIQNMYADYSYGIIVQSSWLNTIISNTIQDVSGRPLMSMVNAGILITGSHNNTISKNTLKNNKMIGIMLENLDAPTCVNNVVSENVIMGSLVGIGLGTIGKCNGNNMLQDNDISGNNIGIHIGPDFYDNIILSNKIHDNGKGICILGASYNIIVANNISQNNYGIELKIINAGVEGSAIYYPEDNTVKENNITDNSLYGVFVHNQVNNNDFYYNNFENNGGIVLGGNAKDSGSNTWDDNNGMGNYWDDYIGFDLNHDGIGDINYFIKPYICGNRDRYPLMGAWPDYYSNQNSQTQSNSQTQHSSQTNSTTTISTTTSSTTTSN